ncbi:hypothetical protein AVEN_143771-1 [Araneus ventricosus]|uniref:Uncharacterized protein n=1 Tax=Araneus ventricosus TaxID=182803 RepID=A0A4Y2AQJ2_ARAVE|nr:hypothetical protein AVEN_143771-1 [Araneus ventricosus]
MEHHFALDYVFSKFYGSIYRRTNNLPCISLQVSTAFSGSYFLCFLIGGHQKSMVYKDGIDNLDTWKDLKMIKVRQINAELLYFAVEHSIQRMCFETLDRSAH